MNLKLAYTSSVIIAVMLMGTAYSLAKPEPAEAVISIFPFAGKLQLEDVCCNGLVYSLDHPPLSALTTMTGDFIFQWQNMIPIPTIGWGLYSSWSLTDGTTVLGDAAPGGVCITIYSECESSDTVEFSINQMGTNTGVPNN